jgi:hypothetical protein
MDILGWLQSLGNDASPAPGFQAQPLYLLVSIALPVSVGLFVGFALRLLERILGVRLGEGGAH